MDINNNKDNQNSKNDNNNVNLYGLSNQSQDVSNSQNNQSQENNNINQFSNNPYVQSTEDNPYYNPYFQNNDIGNSPYLDNSNINDIYNQSYTNIQPDDLVQPTDNNQDNSLEQNNIDATNISINSDNSQENIGDTVNLFNLNSNEQDSTVTPVNPILSQNLNQTEFNDSNNQFDNYDQNFANNQFSTQPQSFDNGQFNSQAQGFNNNPLNNQPQSFDNGQFNNQPQSFDNDAPNNSYGSSNDDEFKNNWMGKLYDKANRRKFSIPAFFFGGLYYLYRKLYIFGFIFVIISCIIPILGINMMSSSLLNATNFSASNLLMPALLTFILPLVINIIYGFAFYPLYKSKVNKKLEKYKNEAQSPTQLLDLARQKGGTSAPFVLLGILLSGVVSSIILTTLLSSTLAQVMEELLNGFAVPQNQLNTNTVVDENDIYTPTYDTCYFYNDYYFEYNSSMWIENEEGNLIYDNYMLSYIQSIENLTSAGFDINQTQGRSSFFTYLYNLFSSQIDATTTTLELGSSSFVYDNGIYYSYFDLVYATSIERCYFVLIPENDIFIEFILSNTDTVIPDEIHNEVVSYICSITNGSQELESDASNGNLLDENATENMDDGISTSGSIDASIINGNDYTNSVSGSASNNTVSGSNGGLTITSPSSVPGITTAYNVVS